jgi:hypothetical protein
MRKKLTIIPVLTIAVSLFAASFALADYGSEKNSKLSGYVKEYKTLRALNGAHVKLYKGGTLKDKDKTNSKGKYSFSKLKSGTYKVKATFAGYRNPTDVQKNTVSKTVKVKGSDKKNLYMVKI